MTNPKLADELEWLIVQYRQTGKGSLAGLGIFMLDQGDSILTALRHPTTANGELIERLTQCAEELVSDFGMDDYAEVICEAAEALAALTARSDGWRDIESAPRDETDCLIYNDRGQFVAWFDSSWSDDGWWMVSDGKDVEHPLRGGEPTHWQPLLTPPETTP